jgi:ADP-ribose pyrophosphatase YjhB (NUDIX family)
LKRDVEPAMGKWVFPGGYVDRGESVQEAAIRETREECQMEVKLGPLLNVYSYPGSPNIIVVYAAQVVGGELAAGDESVEARVFAPTEIPWNDLAFDSTKDALKDYISIHMRQKIA